MNGTWMLVGLLGQAVFSGRFLVQWVASERAGRSIVPRVFWHLSIVGSLLLLSYAVSKRDTVFILGQSAGLAVYFRNLLLTHRDHISPTRG